MLMKERFNMYMYSMYADVQEFRNKNVLDNTVIEADVIITVLSNTKHNLSVTFSIFKG